MTNQVVKSKFMYLYTYKTRFMYILYIILNGDIYEYLYVSYTRWEVKTSHISISVYMSVQPSVTLADVVLLIFTGKQSAMDYNEVLFLRSRSAWDGAWLFGTVKWYLLEIQWWPLRIWCKAISNVRLSPGNGCIDFMTHFKFVLCMQGKV